MHIGPGGIVTLWAVADVENVIEIDIYID